MPTTYIIISILCFSSLSVLYKVAHKTGCKELVFIGMLNLVAALISSVNTLVVRSAWRAAPAGAITLGLLGGLAGVLGMHSMLRALKRQAPLAIISTLLNLSILIPILFATLFLGETVTLTRVVGLLLFVVFIVLLNLSRENEKTAATGREPSVAAPRNWLPLAFAAFFLNGLVLIAQRGIGAWYAGWEDHFLLGVFATGALACGLLLTWQRHKPIPRDAVLGGMAGIIAYGGNYSLIRALGMADSYQVLPLVFGVWIALIAVISWLVFGERLTPRSAMALGVGMLGIVLLNLSAGA